MIQVTIGFHARSAVAITMEPDKIAALLAFNATASDLRS